MTSSIDFKQATSFACGTPERNAETPKETTLAAAIQGLNSQSATREAKNISTPAKEGR